MTDTPKAVTPLAIDLFAGLGGWTEGLLAEGYRVVGFDIERHEYGDAKYPAQLVIQDVLTLHGSQFKDAALIVASPPCQQFSYMAMPWSRAKAIAADYRSGKRDVADLTRLFDACFRIQREASEAAGHHIPMVVENVRGAIPWVGRSRWNFGSFHLWGDVPALMPFPMKRGMKGSVGTINGSGKHREQSSAHRRISEAHRSKSPAKGYGAVTEDGIKQGGLSGPRTNGKGDGWFEKGAAKHGSKSNARKAASAMIAKIPLVLSTWVAKTYYPPSGGEHE